MPNLATHFRIFRFLSKVWLLSIFLFTSTLSFAIDCTDHSVILDNHTHTNISKASGESSDWDKHDEGCHTSEKIQRDSSVQLKKQGKISPIFHTSLVDTYNINKISNNFWIVKKVSLPRDPPGYSHINLVWIVVINC